MVVRALLRPVPFLLAMGTLFLVNAHAFTIFLPGFGLDVRLYTWTFVLLTLFAAAAFPLLQRRRVTSLTLAVTGTVVLATSVILVYANRWLAYADLMEWMRFWHSAWAWAFVLAFLVHVALNRVRLTGFMRTLAGWRGARGAFVLLWAGLAAAAAWSVTPWGRDAFTRDTHVLVVTLTVLGLALALLAAWGVLRTRVPVAGASPTTRARTVRTHRRALVDDALLTATVLAVTTGFLVLYLRPWMRMEGVLRVGLYWHSVTSGLMIALALAHAVTNRRALLAHARRVAREVVAPSWSGR